jgi:hypothetical protein
MRSQSLFMVTMFFNGMTFGVLIGSQIARGAGRKLRLAALRKARQLYLRRAETSERATAHIHGNKS